MRPYLVSLAPFVVLVLAIGGYVAALPDWGTPPSLVPTGLVVAGTAAMSVLLVVPPWRGSVIAGGTGWRVFGLAALLTFVSAAVAAIAIALAHVAI